MKKSSSPEALDVAINFLREICRNIDCTQNQHLIQQVNLKIDQIINIELEFQKNPPLDKQVFTTVALDSNAEKTGLIFIDGGVSIIEWGEVLEYQRQKRQEKE